VTAVIRAEFAKLTTVRLPVGLLGIAVLLTAAMSLLTALQAGSRAAMADSSLDTAAGLAGVLSTTYFAMIMAMVLGITISTGEFRHATATATYLAVPRRVRVLAAKAITALGAGLLFGRRRRGPPFRCVLRPGGFPGNAQAGDGAAAVH
jgi:ABC-2 type transport system permease protein